LSFLADHSRATLRSASIFSGGVLGDTPPPNDRIIPLPGVALSRQERAQRVKIGTGHGSQIDLIQQPAGLLCESEVQVILARVAFCPRSSLSSRVLKSPAIVLLCKARVLAVPVQPDSGGLPLNNPRMLGARCIDLIVLLLAEAIADTLAILAERDCAESVESSVVV
jgi:hypothetical protein